MVDIVTAYNRGHFATLLDSMFEDRKNVFIDLLRWDLPVIDGRLEVDQFDDDYAVYLLISDPAQNHMGSMRLLPTDRAHILGDIFPFLCTEEIPKGHEAMEITRLCLCPGLPALVRLQIRNRLISGMVDYALLHSIKTFTGVVTERFFSQVLAMGWRCEPLELPQMVNGTTIVAFRIDIDFNTPHLLDEAGIYVPGEIQSSLEKERQRMEQKNAE
ncbi:acyl-homoserine-lactone synthase [Acidocella sp.]|uniref:acyl-homoserine-lactone synthase n=1 Tax=Acidocella sp. TaxID=50710 RepID=UPI0026317763|nr:acyl-homoserine-lactone synthase [Acidocella sp.]